MRSLFLALLLVLACAGGAQAQERVRTGRLTPSTQAQTPARAVPARISRTAKAQTRATVGRSKASPAARASVQHGGSRRNPTRPAKRPAPRS